MLNFFVTTPRIQWLAFASIAVGMVSFTGCAGKNIHANLKDDPAVLQRDWTIGTRPPGGEAGDRGFEFSNPIVTENTVIFGNQSVGLISLYPTLMQRNWTLPIHGGVISELAYEGENVYFGGGDGFLYSVHAESGRVNWRYDLRNPIISRPTLQGGRLFVTSSDDTVYAFDAGTGKWLWHYRRRSAPSATIMGASAPLVDGDEVFAGLSDGFLVSLSMQDGQLKWEKKLHQGTRFTDVDAHPIIDAGVLYVPSYDGSLYALKRQGGEILWRFDAGGSHQVVASDPVIYLASTDGSVYAIQKSNAKILWRFEMDGGVPTRLVVTENRIIFGSSNQYLYVVDRATGQGMYRFNVGAGSGFYGTPAYDTRNGRLYMLSGAGNLYAFRLKDQGKKVSRASAGN